MCGIVGFVSKNDKKNILNDMLEIQSYRGPDDRGVYFDKDSGVYLGHNRLSILDLSKAGHQPMISNCGNYIIVFNGEVYNFKEIQKELKILGYKFNSNSDTEVILNSYIEWGIKAIDKFRGMFAIAIFDKIKNKLILIRDRAGVKPLYYYINKDEFLFSSEIKSFHKYDNFKKELNYEVLPYYFQFGYIPTPYSIFKNCFKLEAGNYLEFDIQKSTFNITKYWDVKDFYLRDKFKKNENEILSDIEDILTESIDLRMVSDVDVGVFLSGGYDSSLVSAILSKKLGYKINTFTIGFDDKKYNEANHAKSIADYLDTNHTEYYMKENDLLELIDKLPFYYDEPFGDSSALPTMIVSRLAKQNVTVALSADGGDEIFGGYTKYFFLNKFQNKKQFIKPILKILNSTILNMVNNLLPKNLQQTNLNYKLEKFKRAINTDSLQDMFINGSSYIAKNEVSKLFKFENDEKKYNKFTMNDNLNFLENMMIIDYKTFMIDDVLVKVDRATMSVSLEGREPLLDNKIIEYLAQVPSNIKFKNNMPKYLLRQILYKYIPQNLIDKPKSGFQIPLDEWLKTKLKYLVDNYLDSSKLDSEIFNIQEIENLKYKFFKGEISATPIWFLIVFQMWKEKWFNE